MKKIAILLSLFATSAAADDLTVGTTFIGSYTTTKPSFMVSMGSPEAYVTIQPDGKIEYGKDYTPDAAAKSFWDAMGVERAARDCKQSASE